MAVNIHAFRDIPLARLQSLQEKYLNCLEAIATAGQSYNVNGRTYTRADLTEVQDVLAGINAAINNQTGNGKGVTIAYPRFT